MKLLSILLLTLLAQEAAPADRPTVVVVVGAAGTEEYAHEFATWTDRWQTAAKQADARFIVVGVDETAERNDREAVQEILADEAEHNSGDLWIVFIGHGTFDGQTAKFNLRGPDLTAADLKTWLDAGQRPTAIINCAASSGPFINALSAPGRIVVTSTKSGSEQNYCRFGDFFSRAVADPQADIDKDGQTSLLEAFLVASRNTEADYKQQGRLATEHALLDDNGDGLGTAADWFEGVQTLKRAEASQAVDGRRAHQFHLVRSELERNIPEELRRQRDELELQLLQLRDQKSTLTAEDYDRQLEERLLELARLYEKIEKRAAEAAVAKP